MGMFDDLEKPVSRTVPRQSGGMFDDLEGAVKPAAQATQRPTPKAKDYRAEINAERRAFEDAGGGVLPMVGKGFVGLKGLLDIGATALERAVTGDTKTTAPILRDTLDNLNAGPSDPVGRHIAQSYEAGGMAGVVDTLKDNPQSLVNFLAEMLPGALVGGGAGGSVSKLAADAAVKKLSAGMVKKLAPRAAAGAGANAGATFVGGLSPNTASAYKENDGDLAKAVATGLKQTGVESAVAAPFGAVLPFGSGLKANAGKALAVSPVDEVAQTVAGNAAIGKGTSSGEIVASALLGGLSAPVDIATALWAAKQGEAPTATPQDIPPATDADVNAKKKGGLFSIPADPVTAEAKERPGMFDDIEADLTSDPMMPDAPATEAPIQAAPVPEVPVQQSEPQALSTPEPIEAAIEAAIEEQNMPIEQGAAPEPIEQLYTAPDVSREIEIPYPVPAPQKAVEADGVRQHIENMIRRRRVANELGKSRLFDNALNLGKELLAGNKVSPAKFKNAAKAFEKDKPLFDDLMALHDLAKSPRAQKIEEAAPVAPAETVAPGAQKFEETPKPARIKKSALTTTDPDLYSEAARRSFLQVLKTNGGISADDAADITGESAVRSARMSPGMFRRGAPGIDLVARRLWETGYLTDEEYNDVDGGVQRARDLVGMALNKEPVLSIDQQERLVELERMADEAAQDLNEAEHEDMLDLADLPMTEAEFASLFDGIPVDVEADTRNLQEQNNDDRSRAESESNSREAQSRGAETNPQGSESEPRRAEVQEASQGEVDRRQNPQRRKSIAEMTPDEMRRELLVDAMTGLGNRRAYEEADRLATQVSIDADGLKWINDNLGHESGDRLLETIGKVIAEETLNGFHISGDEYVIQTHTKEEADAIMARVVERLNDVTIESTTTDGDVVTMRGIGISYGIDGDLNNAEKSLREHKAQREREGLRGGRGAIPPNAVIGKQGGQDQQNNDSPEEEKPTLELTGQTPAEIAAAEARDKKAAEKSARDDAKPSGPDVTADQVDMFNTQSGLFDRPAVSISDNKNQIDSGFSKDPWNMTFDAYRQSVKTRWGEAVTDDAETTQELRLQHLDFIETALEEGKTVSAEALAGHAINAKDYPLAAERQGKEPPATLPKGKAKESQPGAPITDTIIEDFGPKIGGARKDMAAAMKRNWTDEDIASQPLSKIWPAAEIDKIEDTFVAAVAFAARQEIPSKPRTKHRVSSWVNKVKTVRGIASFALESDSNRERLAAELTKVRGLEGFMAKVSLLEAVPRDQWKRIEAVNEYPDSYRYDESGKQVASPFVRVSIDGKSHVFGGASSVAEVVERVNEKLGAAPTAKKMQFTVRGRGNSFFIHKDGDGQYRKLKTFTDAKAALDFRENNHADLVAAWESVKESDNVKKADVRGENNRPRTGKDHRQGKDVSSEQFHKAFGFKAGEFGNWVKQGVNAKQRQGMINGAYDALMDLSDIIGVPPQALSLDGELSIAFGARGSGKFAAHYEPDALVINLTKTRGAGTLAHEWFHALDNYFQRRRGAGGSRESRYITYSPEAYYEHPNGLRIPARDFELAQTDYRETGRDSLQDRKVGYARTIIGDASQWTKRDAVRPEVESRFSELVEALNKSPMTARAATIDQGKSDGYWSRIIERAARSFENYVIAKMAEKGYHNDYLANVVSPDKFVRDMGRYPYLKDDELAPVVEAFDNLFDTIETKETDTGIALFKRSDDAAIPESEWLSEAAVAQVVEERLAQFSHQPPVLIRDSEADVGIVSDAVASGMVRGGKIYLFRDGMADTAEVTRTLWHEMLHYGLRRFLTKEQYIASMKRLYENDAWIKARADSWLAQSGDDTKKAQAKGDDYALARGVDEALAELAESNAGEFTNNSLKARALRTVARWIAMLADRFGFKESATQWRGITNDDARELVKTIFGKLRDDAPATSDDWSFTADSTYSRRVPSGPNSPQQPIRYPKQSGFNLDRETAIEGVQRKHQDSMNRWAKVQRQIVEQGGTVGLDQDVYHAMERMSGRAADRIDQFTHATIKPLLSRMAELETGLDEIGTYLMALGAKDRNAYIQTIRQDMPDNGSGVSDAEAAQIVADYQQRADFAEFDQLARDFQQITDRKLKVLVGGGVITQQQATQAQKDFGFYVPYKGFEKIDETGQRGNGTGLGYSTPSRASKRAFGRVSKAGQVVENIIRDYEAAVILAEKVNVGRYARALADANPDPALWTVDQPPTQPVMTGGSVALMQAQFDAENEIRYIENGKAVRIQLHDPLLAQTYNNLGQEPLNTLLRAGDALNRVLRQTYTQKNPAFIFVNAMRDIQSGLAAIIGEMGAASAVKSLKHAPGAWRAASAESLNRGSVTGEWAKYMAAYRKSGAAVAYYAIGDIEAKQTKLNELLAREGGLSLLDQWKQKGGGLAGAKASAKLAFWRTYNNAVVDVIEALNGGFENMMRLSAFRQYIDEHGGIDNVSRETLSEASRIAKNLTVNFNRKGEKTRAMNAAYLFWNANVQGSQNLSRLATKSLHNDQVKALMGGMVGLGFLMSMTTDDEDDELTPGYVKNTSIVLHIDGKRIQIPLAYGLGYFVAMGYEMGSLVKGRQTPIRTGLNVLSSALMHFSPLGTPIHDGDTDIKSLAIAGTPTILKPIVMSATNRNSMGYEVVPKYDDEAPDRPAMRANTRGGVYDKAAGGLEAAGLDVSPESIKMATTFIAGGLGTFLADSVSASMAGSKGEFDPEKTPILKRFYGVNDIEEHRARFYDQTEDVQTQAREQGKKQKEFFGSNKSEDSVQDFRKVMKELREEEMDAFTKSNFTRAEALQDKQIKLATRFKVLHDRMIKNGRIEKR